MSSGKSSAPPQKAPKQVASNARQPSAGSNAVSLMPPRNQSRRDTGERYDFFFEFGEHRERVSGLTAEQTKVALRQVQSRILAYTVDGIEVQKDINKVES